MRELAGLWRECDGDAICSRSTTSPFCPVYCVQWEPSPSPPAPGVKWMFSRRAFRVCVLVLVALVLESTPEERGRGVESLATLLGHIAECVGEVTGLTVAHLLTEVPFPRWLVVVAVVESLSQ